MWVQTLGWGDSPREGKWQPTPVFLPGKPHGQRSLVGYSPWGHKESDKTEQLSHQASKQGMRSPQIHSLKTHKYYVYPLNASLFQKAEVSPIFKPLIILSAKFFVNHTWHVKDWRSIRVCPEISQDYLSSGHGLWQGTEY